MTPSYFNVRELMLLSKPELVRKDSEMRGLYRFMAGWAEGEAFIFNMWRNGPPSLCDFILGTPLEVTGAFYFSGSELIFNVTDYQIHGNEKTWREQKITNKINIQK